MRGLSETVAIVTGGSSGIGKATAERLADEWASVVVADVAEDEGRSVAAAIEAAGGDATFVPTDVTSSAAVEDLVAETVDVTGQVLPIDGGQTAD